jgi:hypothetical protein
MKKTNGRPTKYRPEYDEQARKLCLLKYTDKQLADFFEVNVDTLYEWKKVHSSFSEAIKKGKDETDGEVINALLKRALGYKEKEAKVFCHEGMIISEEFDKVYPPDVAACFIWLKNRQGWRDRQELQKIGEETKVTVYLPDSREE